MQNAFAATAVFFILVFSFAPVQAVPPSQNQTPQSLLPSAPDLLTPDLIEPATGTEFLSPEQKNFLEEGLEHSQWPSYCPLTAQLATRSVAPPMGPLTTRPETIVVDKARRLIHLMHQEQIIATYRTALGGSPIGNKEREGDSKTPEGRYFIELKYPKSEYHLSLRINYPNRMDIKNAALRGIQDPGKNIMFHGLPNNWFKRKFINHPKDWTRGCMAVTDQEIQQMYASIDLGTFVEICP